MNLNQNISRVVNSFIQENEREQLNTNFKQWFADSKIINKNGSPLVVYHGTKSKGIQFFDASKIGQNKGNLGHYGYGFYFSTDIREAKGYGSNILECYLSIKNPFKGTDKELMMLKKNGFDEVDDIVDLAIDFKSLKSSLKKNPFIYDFLNLLEKKSQEKAWEEVLKKYKGSDFEILNDITDIIEYTTLNPHSNGIPDYVYDILKDLNVKPKIIKGFETQQSLHWITDLGENSQHFTDTIKKMGYDGVWYGSEIVAFYPTQIKSIKNDGSWDIDDKNIYS